MENAHKWSGFKEAKSHHIHPLYLLMQMILVATLVTGALYLYVKASDRVVNYQKAHISNQ